MRRLLWPEVDPVSHPRGRVWAVRPQTQGHPSLAVHSACSTEASLGCSGAGVVRGTGPGGCSGLAQCSALGCAVGPTPELAESPVPVSFLLPVAWKQVGEDGLGCWNSESPRGAAGQPLVPWVPPGF